MEGIRKAILTHILPAGRHSGSACVVPGTRNLLRLIVRADICATRRIERGFGEAVWTGSNTSRGSSLDQCL